MSIRYHGNWCGPGWSNGQYRPSERGNAPAIDEFDETCRQHDYAYSDGIGVNDADALFYEQNIGRGLKRSVAALAVRANAFIRPSPNKTPTQEREIMPHVRGVPVRPMPTVVPKPPSKPKPASSRPARAQQFPGVPGTTVTRAPVSIGTTITATAPRRTTTLRGCRLQGREFMASVYESSNANWQLTALCPLHPAYFTSSTIGNICRGFSRYKWNRLTVHFVTRQPTSVTGEIALCYSSNCLLPAENGASGAFLPRVMSRGNAILGPLWTSHSINIPCDNKLRYIDAFSSIDFNLNVMGEVQAYTLAGVTDTAGYLLMDYDIEFADVMYQPHGTLIPLATGTGTQIIVNDSSTTPTASNAVKVTGALLTTASDGTVYRCILDLDQSTLSTGTTAANAWETNVAFASTLTSITSTARTITLVDGMQFYLTVIGSNMYAYNSYEAAVGGDGTGQFFYQTTGSTAASLQVMAYLVRTGVAVIPVIQ
jgi:hypothetical protein